MVAGGRRSGTVTRSRAGRPWVKAFLHALGQKANVRYACEAAKIHRATVYQYREEDPRFRAAWDSAIAEAIDRLEEEAWEWSQNPTDPRFEVKTSADLLKFLLRANRIKYRDERGPPTIVLKIGESARQMKGGIDLEVLSTDELRAIVDGEFEIDDDEQA